MGGYCGMVVSSGTSRKVGIPGPRFETAEQFEQNHQLHTTHQRRKHEMYPEPEPAANVAPRWPKGLHECTRGPRGRVRDKWIPEEAGRKTLEQRRLDRRG